MGGQKQAKSRSRNKHKKVKPSKSGESFSWDTAPFSLFMNEDGELYYAEDDPKFMPEKSDMESDEALWELYLRWCRHHRLSRTLEELKLRFPNFKRNAFCVFKLNQKSSSCKFCMYDWCDEEEQEIIVIGDDDDRVF